MLINIYNGITFNYILQPFSRAFDASSPPAVAAGNAAQFFFPPGAPVPYFQGGVAYYPQPAPPAPGDPSAQTQVYQSKFNYDFIRLSIC